MSIAALGMAATYLLIVVAGAIGALSLLVWLFRDAPDPGERTGHGQFGCLRRAGNPGLKSSSSIRDEPGHPEDEAA